MGKSQILVVEDDNIVVMELEDSLQSLGYAVSAVASYGKEAIEKAAEMRPDLVLMDIRLKGNVNGIDAAQEIRERFDIPVIYLTAYADEDTLQRAKRTEPYGYIVKPFEERELHSVIEMALYKHRMERKLKESERWLATTLRSIGDAVIATDEKGLIVLMNSVAEDLTGWKQKDAWGKDLTEVFNIIDEKTRTLTESPATRAIREGVVIGLANHSILIAKDGREIPIDDSAAPIRDDKGGITGVVLTFRDITERKRAGEALRRAHGELEMRVQERTAELAKANEALQAEIAERERAEEALHRAHDELEIRVQERTAELAEANEALQAEIAERERAEKAIKQRNRELATLLEASQRLARRLELDELLSDIARSIVETLPGAEASSLWLYDEKRNELAVRAWSGYDDEVISGLTLSPDTSLVGLVHRSRQPIIIDDLARQLAFEVLDRPAFSAVCSALGVPLLVEGRSIGALFADNFSRPKAFDENDLRLLQSLAAQAAVAIQNARLFEQVRAGRERLQALSRRVVEVQEAERRHTALELHDEIGQLLTGLKFTLEMGARLPADKVRASLDEVRSQVSELIMRVDDLSLDLRPAILDDLGLLPALLWHLERYTTQTNVHVTFRHSGLEGQRFAPEVETAAYRIVQEALTNVARHADVSEVMVRAWADQDALAVQIEDQGAGFDPEAALAAGETTGVAGMRDRAVLLGGKLTIESAPGRGTGLTAEFPLGDYPLERREMER
jgi:PAS domain S-box-containing protein